MRRAARPQQAPRLLSAPSTSRPAAAAPRLTWLLARQHPAYRLGAIASPEPLFGVGSRAGPFRVGQRPAGLDGLPDRGLRILGDRSSMDLLTRAATHIAADRGGSSMAEMLFPLVVQLRADLGKAFRLPPRHLAMLFGGFPRIGGQCHAGAGLAHPPVQPYRRLGSLLLRDEPLMARQSQVDAIGLPG